LINDRRVGLERIIGADDGVDMGGVEGVEVSDVIQLAAVAFGDGDNAGALSAEDRAAAVLLFDAGGTEHEAGDTYKEQKFLHIHSDYFKLQKYKKK